MAFQAPITVSDVVSRIREHRLLLPAIQREFVWGPEKVEWLFDSLLQGFPIGSFLFWEVRDEKARSDFRYYEFIRTFRERYLTHNPEFNTAGHREFDAVLDGQQRLTAIYIGLTGTYAYKMPRRWWEDTEHALPTRKLYLNIVSPAPEDDEETGRVYEFKFLTDAEYENEKSKWFLVGRILELAKASDLTNMLIDEGYQTNRFAADALSTLHSIIHIDRLINYYAVRRSNMDEALNVFVRVNSGGEPLSLSDMLMSTMIANWQSDARKKIFGLVDELRAKGFFVSKDLILKTCLYLYSSDIRYKASNFSSAQVKPFEDNWESIHSSILAVFDLVRDFGYNESSLTSKNALLPIVYWVHHRELSKPIASSVRYRTERDMIRKWLHLMLLKGVFGGAADTVLTAIRKAFAGDDFGKIYVKADLDTFPSDGIGEILRAQGKDPQVTEEFIDTLLYTQCEDRSAFTLLALLSPNLDYKNGDFHKDHLHPASAFRKSKSLAAKVVETDLGFYQDSRHWNSILNLRHLDSAENQSKGDTPLVEWVASEAQRQEIGIQKFCIDHQFPSNPEQLEFSRFRDFIAERRATVGAKLRELLS